MNKLFLQQVHNPYFFFMYMFQNTYRTKNSHSIVNVHEINLLGLCQLDNHNNIMIKFYQDKFIERIFIIWFKL